jgi:hypothetical protein
VRDVPGAIFKRRPALLQLDRISSDDPSRLEGELAANKLSRMKGRLLLVLGLLLLLVARSADARSIRDIPAAKEALLRIVSPKFYQSLTVSPVASWVVVRGELVNDRLAGARIVRSENGDDYAKLALDLANNLQIVDLTRVDRLSTRRSVLVHVLGYQIADGTMAISFAHLEGPGSNQLRYSGAAWMAIRKGDSWVAIDPKRLAPYERRGPRMYTLAVEPANSQRSLQGNGRPPPSQFVIEGAPVSATHALGGR